MREKILEILEGLRPDLDFNTDAKLVDDAILDSFDIVSLAGELSVEFDVDIDVDDIVPENLNSIDAMVELIKKLEEEQ